MPRYRTLRHIRRQRCFPTSILRFERHFPVKQEAKGLSIDWSNRVNALREQYHYAWVVVGTGTVLRVTANFVSQAFAVILVVLQQDFAWSVTAIVLAQVLRSVSNALLSPVAGWFGDRYGARRTLLVAATLYVVGMLLLSTINQLWQLYAYYSILLGLAQALFAVNIPTTVAAWFKKKLGVAVGIQQSVGGMGASVTAPALALLLSQMDWQVAFWIIAVVGGVIIFSLLAFFHSEPSDKGLRPLGADDDDPGPVRTDRATARLRSKVFLQHARRTRAFYNLPFIHFLGCVGHSIVIWHVVFFATTQGVSLAAAAWIVTLYTVTSISSRLFIPILADQSLAKLEDLSPTMRDTILANVGCLAVFQVAGNDARQLVWELGKDRVSEDDVTSLDVHHCYVRATVGTERMPAFSMMVRKPEDGDPAVAERIRANVSAYTLSGQDLSLAGADSEKRVSEYRRLLAERNQDNGAGNGTGAKP